jgi:energy-coupling factor transport system ATP-binding protein
MLVMEPRVLLLDEPCAQLDQDGLDALNSILEQFLIDGGSIVLGEHDPAPLRVIRHIHVITDNSLRPAQEPRRPVPLPHPAPAEQTIVAHLERASLVLENRSIWEGLDLSLRKGEIAIIQGDNGSGKTSLLRCLTGFQPLSGGSVAVFGQRPAPATVRNRIGYLIQNPARQLTADTVLQEIALPYRFRKKTPAEATRLAEAVLDRLGLERLARRAPFLLSHGEQHLVALASVLAVNPEILLLDDPFVGLDADFVARVWAILHGMSESGVAVVCALHRKPAGHGAHTVFTLQRGGLTPC